MKTSRKSKHNQKPTLERRLSFADAVFFEVGGIIGAGVFVLIGLAAGMSGPALVVAVALAGFVSLVTALSYAEISSAIPLEGGEYEYAHKLVSPLAGFLTLAGWLVSDLASSAVVALGFASYLSLLVPSIPIKTAALAAVAIVTAINVFGVKLGARTNDVISIAKIAVLAFFVLFSLAHFNPSNFTPLAPFGTGGVVAAAALFFFAYSGFGKITRLGEEVVDAENNLPRSILTALVVCTVLYVLTAVAIVGAVGWSAAASTNSPLSTALSLQGSPGLAFVIALGALAATLSVLLTNNMGISRLVFAFGRKNPGAAWLSELHESFKTPWRAIVLAGLVTALLTFVVDLKTIASAASLIFIGYYGVINAIAIVARSRRGWNPKFRTPWFPLFPLLGIASCLLLLAGILLR